MSRTNREIILTARPKGMVDLSHFSLVKSTLPELKEGEVLVRTLYLTVDPYMRGRMNDTPSYIEPFALNKPLVGGVVGKVEESKSAKFKPGDVVLGFLNWADYTIADAKVVQKLVPQQSPISTALGVLGMPGMTAFFGLLDIGQPKRGETLLVSGAAGAVGSLVGQIGKIKGCRVVGIAGGEEKVNYLLNDLGFDAAIDYKQRGFADDLKQACSSGIDVYFDNVGGEITDQALKWLNLHARIVICGQISLYNLEKPDIGPRNWWLLLTRRAMAKGFIVSDYAERFPEGLIQMSQWIEQGKIEFRETITEGLENAPAAFIGLFKGENIGKQLVKV
jgi:NADPH:quinone reductase